MHFHGPIIRPQTDTDSLFIEITAGCTHNSCTFCNFYKDTPFFAAPLSQIEEDLKEAKSQLPHVKNIWASGGNPFALGTDRQIKTWSLIKKYYPDSIITTYATIIDFKRKTTEEIKSIKKSGLDKIMIGVETGDDEVLSFVNKGYTSQDIIAAGKKMDEAGIPYRIIYLGGLAGKGKLAASAKKTAEVFNQIHPYHMMLTNVIVLPGTKLHEQMQAGIWTESTEKERIEEMRSLIANLKNPITIDSGTSASSVYFVINLPEDKNKILKQLDKIIAEFSDKDERTLLKRRHSMLSA